MQTDAPLKRAIKPLGGVGIVKAALEGGCTWRLPPATSSLALPQGPTATPAGQRSLASCCRSARPPRVCLPLVALPCPCLPTPPRSPRVPFPPSLSSTFPAVLPPCFPLQPTTTRWTPRWRRSTPQCARRTTRVSLGLRLLHSLAAGLSEGGRLEAWWRAAQLLPGTPPPMLCHLARLPRLSSVVLKINLSCFPCPSRSPHTFTHTQACLTPTPPTSAPRAPTTSSPACPTATGGGASSATTAACRCTVRKRCRACCGGQAVQGGARRYGVRLQCGGGVVAVWGLGLGGRHLRAALHAGTGPARSQSAPPLHFSAQCQAAVPLCRHHAFAHAHARSHPPTRTAHPTLLQAWTA